MLDAGRAKKHTRDPHIKHITDFEPRAICKLLNSPDYIGRSYSRKHTNPEKYIKNKQICKLIDEIRYQTGSREKDSKRKHSAKLHYTGFIHNHLDGGNATNLYNIADKLDLGDAGPECYEGLIPVESKNLEEDTCVPKLEYTRYSSSYLHYKGFNYSNVDGGNAKSSYGSVNKLNLGNAGDLDSCNTLDKSYHYANLHYKEFLQSTLDGGISSSSYTSVNKLDLGNASIEPYSSLVSPNSNILKSTHHSANLHYKQFLGSQLNGGNASSLYNSADKLDLGGARLVKSY